MKDFSTPVDTAAAAEQAGWCEVYDVYLKSAISTPWGSTSTLRLTNNPAGLAFFTPQIAPEPAGTRGDAAAYVFWPMKRELVRSDAKFTNDKMRIAASNVSADWQGMLAAVDWYDTAIVIRLVPFLAGATANDCAVLWTGQVDAARITLKAITLECSNDMASLARQLPGENMHTACRFQWGDDQCTAIRLRAENYKAKTCGASSAPTLVKSADFTEDTGASASYGTDLVDALANAAITTSSERSGYTAEPVTVDTTYDWFSTAGALTLKDNDPVTFAGDVLPGGISAGTTYYVFVAGSKKFRVGAQPNPHHWDECVDLTSAGTNVTVTSNPFQGFTVKASTESYWKFATDADWGTLTNGLWLIPDAQAGVANGLLKPYITFDFGSAKSPKCWRIKTVPDQGIENLSRLLVFFSSPDASTWTHETYFECPPAGGVFYDVLIPNATSARYWRICVRTRWSDTLAYSMLDTVCAYETSRNWWAGGRITFAADTATAALRNVSRRVVGSYSGEAAVLALPVSPASGDTFIVERGCRRTFNACCERRNWENFGGFLDLPYQAVVR